MQYIAKTARGDTVVTVSTSKVDVDCGRMWVGGGMWEHSVVFIVDPGCESVLFCRLVTTAEGRLRCARKQAGWLEGC